MIYCTTDLVSLLFAVLLVTFPRFMLTYGTIDGFAGGPGGSSDYDIPLMTGEQITEVFDTSGIVPYTNVVLLMQIGKSYV